MAIPRNASPSTSTTLPSVSPDAPADDVHWVLRLGSMVAGYGLVALFGCLLIRWVQRRVKENDHQFRQNRIFSLLRLFAVGRPECGLLATDYSDEGKKGLNVTKQVKRQRRRFATDCIRLSIYFSGIQICLVGMGVFQERIVTRGYPRADNSDRLDMFRDTQFLVLANRVVALVLSGLYLMVTWKSQPVHIPPLYLHSFASFSNVISSWCQYEALKYVSFPVQTVCKASKVIPTMLMGKLLRRQRYSIDQYAIYFTLVIGASLFFLASPHSAGKTPEREQMSCDSAICWLSERSKTISGLMLMAGYLFCDAFTPNWQKKLFDRPPRISCSQMMFAVNAFSALLCLVTLLQQWTLFSSLQFFLSHESISADCLLLSLGSAFGQVFIYLTIQYFGPVVLSIVMTMRQIFSIILSSIYFAHPISSQGGSGLILVFGAVFLDIYGKYRKRGTTR